MFAAIIRRYVSNCVFGLNGLNGLTLADINTSVNMGIVNMDFVSMDFVSMDFVDMDFVNMDIATVNIRHIHC
jgi:hypothetical protein